MCGDCLYCEKDSNEIPCNSCIHWVDGYMEHRNYVNKYINWK